MSVTDLAGADTRVRLYSVAQIKQLWGMEKDYVYGEIRAGRLPVVDMGNGNREVLRVREPDVIAWIEARRKPQH